MSNNRGVLSSIGDWLSKLNNSVSGVSALLLTSIGILYMAWEFSDRWQERTLQQSTYEKHESDKRQAYYIGQIWKRDLDSLMKDFNHKNTLLIEQSIKKDSALLLILPQMTKELNRVNEEIDKLNHKFNAMVKTGPKSDRTDFIRLLNERDSIRLARSRNDSINQLILEEIKKANYQLLMMNFPTAVGNYNDYWP